MGKHRSGAREHVEAVRERAAEAKGRADELVDRAQQARGRVPLLDMLFRTGERDRDAGGGLIAAALAFRLFLYMVPFVFVTVLILSALPWTSDDPSTYFGGAGVASYLASAVSFAADQSFFSWVVAFIAGLFALAWTALSFIRALTEASRFAWSLPYRRRSTTIRNTGALLAWTVAMGFALGSFSNLHGDAGFLLDIVLVLVALIVYSGLWMLLLTRLPRRSDAPWLALVPGSLLFGLGFLVIQVATAVWMSWRIEHSVDKYGDLGTAVALLAWLAVFGRLAVGSSVVNAALWERAHPSESPESDTGPEV